MTDRERQQQADQAEDQEDQRDSGERVNDPLAQRDQQAPRTDWKPEK